MSDIYFKFEKPKKFHVKYANGNHDIIEVLALAEIKK